MINKPDKKPGKIIALGQLKIDTWIGRAKGRRREDRRLPLRELALLNPGGVHRSLPRAA